ncbi:nitrite reductase small subunit NirD [Paenibacillus agaridevorans]|uniref:nitrite reductase small subunit NirD n=1 Tax=Paenibacillus agaridevorans TaxID=171404 RepID=UPI001BE457C0|nr:nitrite reductase small subunit NirD [Paenibacillus agaridevorans]
MTELIVAHVSEFQERRSRVLKLEGIEIAVFKLSDGSLKAIENSCPHKQGKLSEGMVCDHHVYCPLHDWKIDLNDGKVQAPDNGCVMAFPIRIDELGNVYLSVNLSNMQAS